MYELSLNQCQKLDQILAAFGNSDNLDTEKVLTIEPNERKANSLIDILRRRGFISRLGETEEKLLPLIIQLEPPADIFMDNGGFQAELERIQRAEQTKAGGLVNHFHIQSSGEGNVINTGNNNTIHHNVNIIQKNLSEFKEALKHLKVEDADVDEIADVVIAEQPENNALGSRANNWIMKMVGKSLSGSWEIASGLAVGLLTEALKKYYGL